MRKILYYLVCLIISFPLQAQDPPPDTDIFLLDIKYEEAEMYFDGIINVTDRKGYDNQPWFHPGGELLYYTSIDEENQADIYIYNLSELNGERFVHTIESEYSPMLTPEHNFISVVQVEGDNVTQRIWRFSQPEGIPELILPEVDSVGYYCWIDEHTIATFIVGEPNTLQILEVPSGTLLFKLDNPGRNLQMIPDSRNLSFVHKEDPEKWVIRSLNLDNFEIEDIITTISGSEDYAWLPNGTLLMGKEGILYYFKPGYSKDWEMAADFRQTEIGNFYRIAVNNDGSRMALVSIRSSDK